MIKCNVEEDNDVNMTEEELMKYMTEEELMKYMQNQQEQPYDEDDDKELMKLRKELEQIVLSNPTLDIDKPYSNTTLEKINSMNASELRARIFQAKRELTCHLDCKISDGALSFANQIIGRMLGCVDELNEQVMNDVVLRESTKDLLSMQVLSKIPPNLKVSGLYAVNVGVALQKAKSNKISQ
jgi:protein required for attachment to host cells